MNRLFHSLFGATLVLILFSAGHVNADALNDIPANIVQNILKRHPDAQQMQSGPETHFGKPLLEVRYKNAEGDRFEELFTDEGHFFTNELPVIGPKEIYPDVLSALKQAFPHYEFKSAELISNPNGMGEEYEIYLRSNGTDWKVSISGQGEIQSKQKLL